MVSCLTDIIVLLAVPSSNHKRSTSPPFDWREWKATAHSKSTYSLWPRNKARLGAMDCHYSRWWSQTHFSHIYHHFDTMSQPWSDLTRQGRRFACCCSSCCDRPYSVAKGHHGMIKSGSECPINTVKVHNVLDGVPQAGMANHYIKTTDLSADTVPAMQSSCSSV